MSGKKKEQISNSVVTNIYIQKHTHNVNSSSIKILKKDVEIKQCLEDPKACLKLAADDKGYVSLT